MAKAKTTKKVSSFVEEMMEKYNNQTIDNDAMKIALEKKKEEDDKRKAEQYFKAFKVIDNCVEKTVDRLRSLRQEEERVKNKLKKTGSIVDQFKEDGNIEKLYNDLREVGYFI